MNVSGNLISSYRENSLKIEHILNTNKFFGFVMHSFSQELAKIWRKKIVGALGHPPGGMWVVPLDPACFRIEDPSRNRLASSAYLAINPTRFSLSPTLLTTAKPTITQKIVIEHKKNTKTPIRTMCILHFFWTKKWPKTFENYKQNRSKLNLSDFFFVLERFSTINWIKTALFEGEGGGLQIIN